MRKAVTALFSLIIVVVVIFPVHATDSFVLTSGKCGNNAYWSLDNSGLLSITGVGPMYDYSYDGVPWSLKGNDYSLIIKKVVVHDGITTVSPFAFSSCPNIEDIDLPTSLESIGDKAFFWSPIRSIIIPEGVKTIGFATFDCSKLVSITLPSSIRTIGHTAFWCCDELETVYYNGSPSLWESIDIDTGNDCLLQAERVYNVANTSVNGLNNFTQKREYTNQFYDIPQTEWYTKSVITAYEYGLVNGTSDHSFSPEDNITIAETIALACRFHNVYYGESGVFNQGEPWYQVYVDYAINNRIIGAKDYSNYLKIATRSEFVSILAKAMPSEAFSSINAISVSDIPDINKNAEYIDEVVEFYNAGIIQGNDKYGTFNPSSSIKRSEVSAIISRMAIPGFRIRFTLEKPPVAVQSISIKPSELSIKTGAKHTLSVSFNPSDASDKTITWTTSNSNVATVSNSGTVMGINEGDVIITATSGNGKTAKCTIKVTTPSSTFSQVSGTVTWLYNYVLGTRGDNGAGVMLIPLDKDTSAYDNSGACLFVSGNYESGIMVTKCDGYGNYVFSKVPTGEYLLLIVSKNTTMEDRFKDENAWNDYIDKLFGHFFSSDDLYKLKLSIGYNKFCFKSITVEEGYPLVISHDFGITYI